MNKNKKKMTGGLLVYMAWVMACSLLLLAFVMQPPVRPPAPAATILKYMALSQQQPPELVLLHPALVHYNHSEPTTQVALLSVLRFAPWVRRIHWQVRPDQLPESEKVEPSEDWPAWYEIHQTKKIVRFSEPWEDYVASAPTDVLGSQLILLKAGVCISNYVFPWQFFLHDQPILRTCREPGLYAVTRDQLQEWSATPEHWTWTQRMHYVYRRALERGEITWADNRDRFVPPCVAQKQNNKHKTPTIISSVSSADADSRALVQFVEPHYEPQKLVLVVVTGAHQQEVWPQFPAADAQHALPLPVWILVRDDDHPYDAEHRLSFGSRTLAQKHGRFEISGPAHQWAPERLGVAVMRWLRDTVKIQTLEGVHGYAAPAANTKMERARQVAHQLASRLSETYECPFEPFVPRPAPEYEPEARRLRMLV